MSEATAQIAPKNVNILARVELMRLSNEAITACNKQLAIQKKPLFSHCIVVWPCCKVALLRK